MAGVVQACQHFVTTIDVLWTGPVLLFVKKKDIEKIKKKTDSANIWKVLVAFGGYFSTQKPSHPICSLLLSKQGSQ